MTSLKIIVCVKQVPDTNEVRIDPVTGTMIRAGVPSILNPDDENALECALQLKDSIPGTHVTVITMGPPQAKAVLLESLAMGADRAILLSDMAFGGADTWATSNTLAAAINKIGDYDLILAGRQAIDGDTAQVGPQLAERLDIPQITYVQNLEYKDGKFIVERQLEDGYEVLSAISPILLTAIKELNEPRYMSLWGIADIFAGESPIETWGLADIGIERELVGLKASPTQVKKSFSPPPKGGGRMLSGSNKEMATELMKELKSKHII